MILSGSGTPNVFLVWSSSRCCLVSTVSWSRSAPFGQQHEHTHTHMRAEWPSHEKERRCCPSATGQLHPLVWLCDDGGGQSGEEKPLVAVFSSLTSLGVSACDSGEQRRAEERRRRGGGGTEERRRKGPRRRSSVWVCSEPPSARTVYSTVEHFDLKPFDLL